jgi:hypothetical protein
VFLYYVITHSIPMGKGRVMHSHIRIRVMHSPTMIRVSITTRVTTRVSVRPSWVKV